MSFEKILKYMGIFLLGTVSVFSQTLRVTGSWTLSIDETYLSGPGGDLLDTYESAPDQILMDIHGQKLESYQVTVQRSDVVWNSYFRVYVRELQTEVAMDIFREAQNMWKPGLLLKNFLEGEKIVLILAFNFS